MQSYRKSYKDLSAPTVKQESGRNLELGGVGIW